MTKEEISHSQEQLVVEPQPQTPFNVISYLNDREGLILLEDLPDFTYDPERWLKYIEFMGEIGVALSAESPRSDTWDEPLGVHEEDFKKASIENLEPKLYFSPAESRRRVDIVTVGQGQLTLDAPGTRGRREGVAVSGTEFRLIARNAGDLAKHTYSLTEKANERRPEKEKLDDETLKNTAGRSVAHVMRERKEVLLALDNELKIERAALKMVNILASMGDDAPREPMDKMDIYRQVSATAIHGIVKVASSQLGDGTTTRESINRALVSMFHRGEPELMAETLKDYTRLAGYYIDAKRGKIYQSLSDCKEVFSEYKHFLKTKKPAQPTTS